MKKSRFSEAQIAFVLKQADEGTAIGEVCRKAGISEATFYSWRKKYGGLLPSAVPLPAGGLLLLTAFGGLAAARRRKA